MLKVCSYGYLTNILLICSHQVYEVIYNEKSEKVWSGDIGISNWDCEIEDVMYMNRKVLVVDGTGITQINKVMVEEGMKVVLVLIGIRQVMMDGDDVLVCTDEQVIRMNHDDC